MKKTALALALVLTISIMIGLQSIKEVEANPTIIAQAAPSISLDSPLNMTYAGNVLLNFTVTASQSWVTGPYAAYGAVQKLLSVDYHVDGSLRGSIVADNDLSSPFYYSAPLTDLQEGSHSLMVSTNSIGFQANWAFGVDYFPANSSSVTVHFNLTSAIAADTIPPIISIISPTNTTYENKVLLHLNITAVSDYQELNYIGYTLDDQDIPIFNSLHYSKREVNWSRTLEDLTEGTHTLKVFVSSKNYFNIPSPLARDSYQLYSGVSDTITFTVAKPFPTTLVTVSGSGVAIALTVIGLFIFFKKRRRKGL